MPGAGRFACIHPSCADANQLSRDCSNPLMHVAAPVQWGIVGCGWVARDYVAPGLAVRDSPPTARLAAACDPDPRALDRLAAEDRGDRPPCGPRRFPRHVWHGSRLRRHAQPPAPARSWKPPPARASTSSARNRWRPPSPTPGRWSPPATPPGCNTPRPSTSVSTPTTAACARSFGRGRLGEITAVARSLRLLDPRRLVARRGRGARQLARRPLPAPGAARSSTSHRTAWISRKPSSANRS